jgi:hypothetical protein
MTAPAAQPALAAILETDDLRRLSTGLSLLVSAASEGRRAVGLAGFGALAPLLADDLAERALDPAATPGLSPAGRAAFARTLAELRGLVGELPGLELWACAAAVEATGVARDEVDARLSGVMSMPRFLRAAAGAELVVV